MNKLASLLIAGGILALFIVASWLIAGGDDRAVVPAAEVAGSAVPAAEQQAGAAQAQPFWLKRCNDQQPPHCELFQRLSVRETGQRLIEAALGFPDGADKAQLGFILPLGIAVSDGVRLQVDEQPTVLAMPVHSCNNDGCVAISMIDDEFVNALRMGKILAVDMLDGRGQKIRIQLSLEGFADQFATLR